MRPSSVYSGVEANHSLYHHHKRVFDTYKGPFKENPKATRTGTNKKGRNVLSRIDYILTNLELTSKWSYHPLLSDHAYVVAEVEKKQLGCAPRLILIRN